MTEEPSKPSEQDLIKQHLFISEDSMKQKLDSLLQRVKKYLQIESATGTVILERKDLQIKPVLCLHLIGYFYYARFNKQDDRSLSISQLSNSVGKATTSLSGPLAELVREGYVNKVGTGKYQIAYYKIEDFLDGFERDLASNKEAN